MGNEIPIGPTNIAPAINATRSLPTAGVFGPGAAIDFRSTSFSFCGGASVTDGSPVDIFRLDKSARPSRSGRSALQNSTQVLYATGSRLSTQALRSVAFRASFSCGNGEHLVSA